ncbi:unnamed protein product [Prorocentrum cordatum]|uniref:Uncharacterized protein n=1 Tax=Prorocentrum cordatum TaxID=2364126 RepID=A0ABN9RDS4_9DINO|nr:unnamed protein product [Polarella glacialis]
MLTSACEPGGQWQRALSLISGILEAKLEPDSFSYTGVSVGENGGHWQGALVTLCHMQGSQLQPSVLIHNAGASACEKGRHWFYGLSLLGELPEATMRPDLATCSNRLSTRKERQVEAEDERPELQRPCRRLREGRAVAAGGAATPQAAGGRG